MKTMRVLFSMMAGSATAVYAAAGSQSEGTGILTYFFIGFFALVIVSQLIPALIMFVGLVRGLFARPEKTLVNKD